jgi:GalNAc-alpha-(1->4)-GalNAc-alpha-(1->3)-diNAcBac-PP-undecaprenol alpha-1,4-N-acetyl-D-galactosaminyltransferase
MRITCAIGSLGCGGAERNLINLSAELADNGHEVTLLTLSSLSTKPDYFDVPASVFRKHVPLEAFADCPWYDISTQHRRSRALRQALLDTTPDLVISFIDTANIRVLTSLYGTSVPVVVCERVNMKRNRIGWRWRVLRQLMYPAAAAVVFQTEAAWRRCRKYNPVWRLWQIPNWIEPPPPEFRWPLVKQQAPELLSGQNFNVLTVGRLHPQKGHDLLIRAIAHLALSYPQIRLVILGEGSARSNLQALIRGLGLQNQVFLVGSVRDPQRWMAACDLFVLPSRFEGFPTALAEAMAVGAPVISCECPDGPAEMIRHQYDGLLVPVDDEQALVEAMQALIDNPQKCCSFSSAAMQISNRYSKSRVIAQWQRLILEVSK